MEFCAPDRVLTGCYRECAAKGRLLTLSVVLIIGREMDKDISNDMQVEYIQQRLKDSELLLFKANQLADSAYFRFQRAMLNVARQKSAN